MLRLIRGGGLRGRGEGRGLGGTLSSSLMAFFNIHVIDIFTTDISHVRGHLAYGLLF